MKQSRTRQRLLSLAAAVALAVVGLAPTAALAEETTADSPTAVAKVVVEKYANKVWTPETHYYTTLQEAVDAAGRHGNDVVTLLQDTTENVTVTGYKKFKIDLNGKTLSGGTDYDAQGNQTEHFNKAALTVNMTGGNVTVTDSVGTGVIKRDDSGEGSGLGSNDGSYYVVDVVNGAMTLAGGTVKNESGSNGSSAVCVGGDGSKSPVLTIDGATVIQNSFIAAKCDTNGQLTIKSGKVISANESAVQNWNKAFIHGGEIDGLVWTLTYSEKGTTGWTQIDGGTVKGELRAGKYDDSAPKTPSVEISGGTLDVTWNIDDTATATVSGGKFTSEVPESYIKDGYMLGEKGADGLYGIEKYAVASIGDTRYETLAEAIKASQPGDTITLLRNVAENGLAVGEGKDLTIDLKGHTISSTSDAGIVVSAGKLVVMDSTATEPTVEGTTVSGCTGGCITSDGDAVRVWDGGQFELKSGMLKTEGKDSIGIYVQGNWSGGTAVNSKATVSGGYVVSNEFAVSPQCNGATVEITGGVLESWDNAVIGGNGSANKGGTSVTISGGTLVGHTKTAGSIACGVYQPQGGTLDITDGTIIADGGAGVVARAGKVSITGGTIKATGNATGKVGDASTPVDSSAVVIDGESGYPAADEDFGATISGGQFSSENGKDLSLTGSDSTKGSITVAGGTFSQPVPDDMAADTYVPVKNADGTFTVAPEEKVHKVTFVFGNGDADQVVEFVEGQPVARPADPTYDGWTFVGWFMTKNADGTLADEYDFKTLFESDVTLYAGWTENKPADGGDKPVDGGDKPADVKPEQPAAAEKPAEGKPAAAAKPAAATPKTGDATNNAPLAVAVVAGVALVAAGIVIAKRRQN